MNETITALGLVSVLVPILTALVKGLPQLRAFYGGDDGTRATVTAALWGLLLTLGFYALGQVPEAHSVGEAVVMAIGTYVFGSGVYAVTKPLHRRSDGAVPPRDEPVKVVVPRPSVQGPPPGSSGA